MQKSVQNLKFTHLLIGFFLLFSWHSVAQSDSLSINLAKQTCSSFKNEISSENRNMLRFSDEKKMARLNPLNYLASGLLFTYQRVFSEQISANCVYHISCSEATKRWISKKGLIVGTLLGLHQLSNCSKNAYYDHAEHAVNSDDKIVISFE